MSSHDGLFMTNVFGVILVVVYSVEAEQLKGTLDLSSTAVHCTRSPT